MGETEKTEKMREQKRAERRRYYGRTANLYPMRPWTPEESQLVLEHSIPDSELSQKIQRSLKSIQGKRRRMKNKEAKRVDVKG
ncbi:MAG: hypothetical protein LUF28_04130 [Clostridiales bacterium]|nr:hypothetical protein [Clostridiales bacterium]